MKLSSPQPPERAAPERFPDDEASGRRFVLAFLISLGVNLVLWTAASGVALQPPRHDFKLMEVTRVVLKPPPPVVKPPPKKPVVKRPVQRPKPKPKPIVRKPEPKRVPPPVHRQPPRPRIVRRPPPRPPQGAHNRVLIAKGPGLPSETHTALPGGNADVGKVIERQNPGSAVVNPPVPVPKPPPPEPPRPVVVQKPPPPEPKPPPPEPVREPEPVRPPPPPPRPRGPTRDAQPASEVKPEIPDELKHEQFKSFVRVRVEVDPDGSFSVVLRTSSGNPEIDRRVLEALKQWHWKPALRDGEPVKSTQLFKFEFEVQ